MPPCRSIVDNRGVVYGLGSQVHSLSSEKCGNYKLRRRSGGIRSNDLPGVVVHPGPLN